MQKIHRNDGGTSSPQATGRKVNVNNSRREPSAKPPKEPKEPKEKSRHPILRFLGRAIATVVCLGIMLGVAMFFSPGFSLAAAGTLIGSYLLCLGGGSVVWGIEFLRKSSEE